MDELQVCSYRELLLMRMLQLNEFFEFLGGYSRHLHFDILTLQKP